MPSAHRRYAAWSQEHFRPWARAIGPNTEGLVVAVLANRPHPEPRPARHGQGLQGARTSHRGARPRTCRVARPFARTRGDAAPAEALRGASRTARLRHNASVEDIDYHAARGLDRALFLIRPFIETGAAGLRSAKTSRAITSANALMLNDSSSARRTGFDSRLPRVLVLGDAEAMAGFPRRTQRKAPRP